MLGLSLQAGELLLGTASLLFAAQAAYADALMLYAWEDEDKHASSRAPEVFEPPARSFTILLPARHEEEVIQGTIQRTVDLNYPRELVQILVVIEAGDQGTIAKVNEKLAELRARGIDNVRLLTFDDPPINKPHGLNVGLAQSTGDIVTIFDAEDEPHPDILRLVNTVVLHEGAPIVQCGVQLMNYSDHWFSALNVLEYFFWFRSRQHYHATVHMVPLGGNTVFMSREVLEAVSGWDQYCLTEDADIGIRLSIAGVPTRVVYDDRYVTQEETPPTVSQFVKQRTRWDQGFIQVLFKGDWLHLATLPQRLLALYTLAFPLFHALLMLYLPVSIYTMLFVKVSEPVAMISTLPLYMLAVQLAITLIGFYEFTSVFGFKPSLFSPIRLLISFLPYNWVLAYAGLRAVWRQLRGNTSWEKTQHTGALRKSGGSPAVAASVDTPAVASAAVAAAVVAASVASDGSARLSGENVKND